MTLPTLPPTQCKAWSDLAHHAESWRDVRLRELLGDDGTRAGQLSAQAPGLRYDFSRQRLGGLTVRLLARLAAERGFDAWREALFSGQAINSTENRAARHTALRSGSHPEVLSVLEKMKGIVAQIRGEKRFKRIVNLGTGGSDLGPRLLADALSDGALDVRFAANIDPKDLARALEGARPESTLFIVVSKTFTTQETMANAMAAKSWGAKHFIAVSSNVEEANRLGALEVLPMWDWVGGRFSVWSAVGLAAACAMGWDAFEEFLAGGREIDLHFQNSEIERNVPALMALVGVWNVDFLGMATHAVLPYSNALRLLPMYLQQLEMESNGKRVDREGRPVDYATCPVVWGLEGTVSQHSFHQLLHQGTQVVPVDFLDFDLQRELTANLRAQADALALGTSDRTLPPHREYPGNRPSSILQFEKVTPRNMGRLLACYEHKVFTQGVVWNINSFDQWGVELGKELARQILKGAN